METPLMGVPTLLFIPWIALVYADVDPCLQVANDNIPNLTGRREDCTFSNSDTNGCDAGLLNKWYKSEYKLATSTPGIGSCGTMNPIWINGTIPNVLEGKVTRTACVHTLIGSCDKSYQIEMKNCTIFYAYHLVPTTACNERYCFEKSSSFPCTTTTTTTTTTTALPKPLDKHSSGVVQVCIELWVFVVVIFLVAAFATILTAAVCIKRQMCRIVDSRPSTPVQPFVKRP